MILDNELLRIIMSAQSLSHKNDIEPIYTLRIASKLSSISVYSIRQYIDRGLIIPYTTKTRRHLFSDADMSRLISIRKYLNELGLNVAGINALFSLVPCWLIKQCSESVRVKCDAYSNISEPCWQSSHKGPFCRNSDCRICEVYRMSETCTNHKDFIKMITCT